MTPIDWKPEIAQAPSQSARGHHSLVTPIDWKRVSGGAVVADDGVGHHSLVTPIDWKLLYSKIVYPLPEV